ncbi:acyl carrier protein [Novosphingobium chloroacetimidivorans]|uniref:Acyl carrier protein n=1 Tax=Novosphingobium chloroacetimidivorans TaxID=1428314 RepID=A0A7W7NY05_9SPHN|nr:phosphopantetheine-binding protein [Novosphingobium chloroacetimidivorans]MBB4859672.1 acyl carrier protein [Novosphingobium chloroacetimidivorans]
MEITAQQDRLLAIVAEVLDQDPRTFTDPMEVKFSQLGADRLDTVELVMTTEEEFSIEITDAEMSALGDVDKGATVGDLWKLVEPKLAAEAR